AFNSVGCRCHHAPVFFQTSLIVRFGAVGLLPSRRALVFCQSSPHVHPRANGSLLSPPLSVSIRRHHPQSRLARLRLCPARIPQCHVCLSWSYTLHENGKITSNLVSWVLRIFVFLYYLCYLM